MRWDRWIFGKKGAVGAERTTQVEKDIGLHGGMVVDSCLTGMFWQLDEVRWDSSGVRRNGEVSRDQP